jgi:hypothetical protein
MYRYVAGTKINENEYEIFYMLNDFAEPPAPFVERCENAINSGLPITGMDTSAFQNEGCTNAVWNGTSFSGGESFEPMNLNWDLSRTYSFLCDNKIFLTVFKTAGSLGDAMWDAAFSQDVVFLKLEDDQFVSKGDIWNGSTFRGPQ